MEVLTFAITYGVLMGLNEHRKVFYIFNEFYKSYEKNIRIKN